MKKGGGDFLLNTSLKFCIRIKNELTKARLFFKEKYDLFIAELEKKANEVPLNIIYIHRYNIYI